MHVTDAVAIPVFIVVMAVTSAAAHTLFGLSFFMACLIGFPAGWLLGMLIIFILANLPGPKREG